MSYPMPLNRKIFFDCVRTDLFGGFLSSGQVSGMSTTLDTWERSGFGDPRWLGYALATSFHETGKAMIGIREWGEGRGRDYGKPVAPWNQAYYGRGMVQLTWYANYVAASKRLLEHGITVDLARVPDDALKNDVAAAVLIFGMAEGWFTGSSLGHWFSPTIDDPVNARRIVNGQDRAQDIAGYHAKFLGAIRAATPAPVAANGNATLKVDADKPELAAIETAVNKAAIPTVQPVSAPADVLPTTTEKKPWWNFW